jgi:UDP-N-acetylglucosamine 1-carboxyvinyltransferase
VHSRPFYIEIIMLEVARIRGGSPIVKAPLRASGCEKILLCLFLAAALLTDEEVVLHHIPNLSDVRFMVEILKRQGAEINRPEKGTWIITAKDIIHRTPLRFQCERSRASVCLLVCMTWTTTPS